MQGHFFGDEYIRKKYKKSFDEAYGRLNPEQKNAVDQIEGPVMVIAGPGTGKTQLLAVRIGKILEDAQVKPHNILCLTFTDAATIAMRNRLIRIIGPIAHQVHIFTFHSFCNQCIQENLDIFGNYRSLEPLSDLDKIDVYNSILEELPADHVLKRLKADQLLESRRLENLFTIMKRENLSSEELHLEIDKYVDRRIADKEDGKLYYQVTRSNFKKGEAKEKGYNDFMRRIAELKAGVELFERYRDELKEMGRYDYQDMILWVLEAFQRDDELLARYQERYLYFLVDEFQDTNGAQKDVLEILVSFWADSPNLFVVGDDDQAIYKFQGANLSNIREIAEKYNPYTVVLDRNYRSSQNILDVSKGLIDLNEERIIHHSKNGLSKELSAHADEVKNLIIKPVIKAYPNIIHEQADICRYLIHQKERKEDMSRTAVIYRKHAQVEKLVEVLEKNKIPINIKRKVDILHLPIVENILNILHYINALYTRKGFEENRLFELMHYNFFNIRPDDIARIAIHSAASRPEILGSIRKTMADEEVLQKIEVVDAKQVISLNQLLEKWTSDLANVTLQVFFQNIINEGQILSYVFNQADKTWLLQVLSTIFDLIKEESNKDPSIKLSDFLELLKKMKDNRLPLFVNKVIHSPKGVHFLTAHSSKGLEFDRVMVIGLSKDVWDKPNSNIYHFLYPDTINQDSNTNIEDERRLLYVAMTRARQELQLSFSRRKENGKDLGSSQFIDEILATSDMEILDKDVEAEEIAKFQWSTMHQPVREVELIDHGLIDRVLENYKLSVTGLNKFLQCPLTFYFESILRVPMARTKYMGFGRAVHQALQFLHMDINNKKPVSEGMLLDHFKKGMVDHRAHFNNTEFEKLSIYGEKILIEYYTQYLSNLDAGVDYKLEVKIDNAQYEGIPLKGVLDKVEIRQHEVFVSDYKTGNFTKYDTKKKLRIPGKTNPLGGDYWRQITFYKILLDSDKKYNWNMYAGEVDFVEPDRNTGNFYRQTYQISREDIELVGRQITGSWKKIMDHEFNPGCGDAKCYWCNFVTNNYVLGENLALVYEDESELIN